jgi:hypothetical protein
MLLWCLGKKGILVIIMEKGYFGNYYENSILVIIMKNGILVIIVEKGISVIIMKRVFW